MTLDGVTWTVLLSQLMFFMREKPGESRKSSMQAIFTVCVTPRHRNVFLFALMLDISALGLDHNKHQHRRHRCCHQNSGTYHGARLSPPIAGLWYAGTWQGVHCGIAPPHGLEGVFIAVYNRRCYAILTQCKVSCGATRQTEWITHARVPATVTITIEHGVRYPSELRAEQHVHRG